MTIISAMQLTCDQCGAEPGEQCTFMYGHGPRRQRKMRHGCHARRVRDAEAVTQAYTALAE